MSIFHLVKIISEDDIEKRELETPVKDLVQTTSHAAVKEQELEKQQVIDVETGKLHRKCTTPFIIL